MPNRTPDKNAVASPETAAAVEAGADDVEMGSKHPAVAGFAAPRSSRTAGADDAEPVPVVVETATPGIARAQAEIEAERLDPAGAVVTQNARERALAGHRAPDTVDLPEARIRVEDNEAALRGLGGVPRP